MEAGYRCCVCDRELALKQVKSTSWMGAKEFCEVCFSKFKQAKEEHPERYDDQIIRDIKPRGSQPLQQEASNETVIMEAMGVGGQVQLLEDRIRIVRKGVSSLILQGAKGDKEILLSQISSVHFKRVGTIANGYIQFAFVGGHEAKGGIWQAARDENTVMFNKQHQPAFERLHLAINERMGIARDGRDKKASSNLDDLERLASLRDKGIITEDEFQQKKKQILGL